MTLPGIARLFSGEFRLFLLADDPRGRHESGGTVAVIGAWLPSFLYQVGKVPFVSSGGDDLLDDALAVHSCGEGKRLCAVRPVAGFFWRW